MNNSPEAAPFFSIIIPVYDGFEFLLDKTLKSIFDQDFEDYEIILVVKKNLEKKLSTLKKQTLREKIERIYISINEKRPFMLNKGVALSRGCYLHFLHEGEYYLSTSCLSSLHEELATNQEIELLTTGFITHYFREKPSYFIGELTLDEVGKGRHLGSLRPFIIKKELLTKRGGFNPKLKSQMALDFLCRAYAGPVRKKHLSRVFAQLTQIKATPREILQRLVEEFKILWCYFGFSKLLFLWIKVNYKQFIKWVVEELKMHFWKKPAL